MPQTIHYSTAGGHAHLLYVRHCVNLLMGNIYYCTTADPSKYTSNVVRWCRGSVGFLPFV